MKYLKLALTLVLVLTLVASVTYAAGNNNGGSKLVPTLLKDNNSGVRVTKNLHKSDPDSKVSRVIKERKHDVQTQQLNKAAKHLATAQSLRAKEVMTNPLQGTHHVGVGKEYPTLASMAAALNIRYAGGTPIVFLLDDASYDEPGVTIGLTPLTSSTCTITIRPNTGNNACVISSSDGNPFLLSGATWLTIEGTALGGTPNAQNLSFSFDGGYQGDWNSIITMTGGVAHVTVTDCIVPGYQNPGVAVPTGEDPGTMGAPSIYVYNYSTHVTDSYITVNNCNLSGGMNGFESDGYPVDSLVNYGRQDSHISVTNCVVNNTNTNGIDINSCSYATVTGNTITNVSVPATSEGALYGFSILTTAGFSNARPSGIYVQGDHAVIHKNLIDNIATHSTILDSYATYYRTYGVRTVGWSTVDENFAYAGWLSANSIDNNIVTRLSSDGAVANREFGFSCESGRWDTLYNNSFYNTGVATNPTGSTIGLQMAGQAYTDIGYANRVIAADNAFSITRVGAGHNLALAPWDVIVANARYVEYRAGSDYNDFFVLHGQFGAGVVSGGSYPTLASWQATYAAGSGVDAHSSDQNPWFTSATDVHLDATKPSAADGLGTHIGDVATDFAGTARNATHPNAGAYEGHGNGVAVHDIEALSLDSPGPAGAPQGLPFSPISFTVYNHTAFTELHVPVTVTIYDPTLAVSGTWSTFVDTVYGGSSRSASIATPAWTPTSPGSYTAKVVVTYGPDVNVLDDTLTIVLPVAGLATVPYTTDLESPSSRSGWFADGDFALGSTSGGNTKLGGAHSGDKAYVTNPGAAGNGYSDSKISHVYSPYFDFVTGSPSGAVLSFYHSISTEPEWDRSAMSYSIDTGRTWHRLGSLNDTNGINWYATTVYNNAAGAHGSSCFDTAYAISTTHFPDYLPEAPGVAAFPSWTSNGDCAGADSPTGPTGYVFVQLDLAHWSVLGKKYVRFRYESYGDGGAHYDGWAFDDFSISLTAPVPTAGSISGKVYVDADGSGGVNGGETGVANAVVTLSYFGVPSKVDTADASGNYTFTFNLPGHYSVASNAAGFLTSQPKYPAKYDLNYIGDGHNFTGTDIGRFHGTVTGHVYNDLNDNGVDNSEPGLFGFAVEVHRDSANGQLVNSGTTDSSGNFSILGLDETYYVFQSATNAARLTSPAVVGGHRSNTVTVSGTSGTATGAATNHYGDFLYGQVYNWATMDINGNGVRDVSDLAGLPTGLTAAGADIGFYNHSNTLLQRDTLGFGAGRNFIKSGLDTGWYYMKYFHTFPNTNWIKTVASDSIAVHITNSGEIDSLFFLFYHLANMNGTVFNDLNGNGVKDGGEPGLLGWSVHSKGATVGNFATDSSGNFNARIDARLGVAADTLAPVGQAGWVVTLGTQFISGAMTSNQTVNANNIGVFHNGTIAGNVFRDRNHNGTKDTLEENLSGVTVTLTKIGGGSSITTTNASGNYSFSDTIGSYYITVTAPAGYAQDSPVSANDTVGAVSNSVVTANFGFVSNHDVLKFRTVPADSFVAGATVKAVKGTTAKKPTYPNYANLLQNLFATFGSAPATIGVTGVTSPINGKAAAYVQPAKFTDAFATFYSKKAPNQHNGTPRGLDFDNKGGLLKPAKSLPQDKQNNVLVANMLALELNLALSANGNTTTGLGALVIKDGGPYDGITIDSFATVANNYMTNWQYVQASTYSTISALAARINNAFNAPFAADTAVAWKVGTVTLSGGGEAGQTGFLKVVPGVAPKAKRIDFVKQEVPKSYAMYQNYPNPFNPTTTINFDLPEAATVTLTIYNMLGQQVATILDHENLGEGQQSFDFNANTYASGVYLYRIVAQNADAKIFTQVKKMVLVK